MSAEKIVKLVLKNQLTPGYIKTLMGMMNPKNKGLGPDKSFEPFIVKTDDDKYDLRIGYSSLGMFDDLQKAKQVKNEQPALSLETIKQKLKKEYIDSEVAAKKYVESKKGKGSYLKLPIKNQFVLANYMHTGHKNEAFMDAVINNDFKGAMKNYTRKGIGNANEFFRNVMFSGPIGENDFGNINQAQNFANNFLDQKYPEIKDDFVPKAEKGGKVEAVAEFTGGELVNNKESEMRSAINKGDNKKAADIFRSQVKEKNITPGEASHKTNPLPVAKNGTVSNKNGKPTGQKAKSGAGIYDHIKDQYNPNMSDEQVVAMVKKNHAKWRKNGMD
jgi:hypothetical protein